MILDTRNSDVIRVVMGGAPSTTQPDFFTCWLELNDGNPSIVYTPGQSDGILDGVTPVEIIPAPTVEGNRVQAKFIAVFNKDTADVTLTFDFFDGTSSRTILKVLLEPDWSVIWEPGGTWHVYDENGLTVVGGGGAPAAHAPTHQDGGSDELEVETQPTSETDTSLVLKPDGAGGLVFGSAPAGGATLGEVWRFSTTITDADPGSGRFRLNNATQASATQIFVSDIADSGVDVGPVLLALKSGDHIYIQHSADSARFHLCEITGTPVDATTYVKIPITVIDSGSDLVNNAKCSWLLLFTGTGAAGTANDVVQARRTSVLALTTSFVDVTLDATDEESDAAVIEHNNTNTDDIDVKASGLYKITYSGDIRVAATGTSTITMDSRVRVNDTTVLPGSESSAGAFWDSSIGGDTVHNAVQKVFYATLAASDKVTLQVSKVEIDGSDTFNGDRLMLTVERAK